MDLVIGDAVDLAGLSRPPITSVYGALLNFRDALAALGDAVDAAPYKAPPRAPILFVKPRNTWAAAGDAITVPQGVQALAMGGTLGVVIGRVACRVPLAQAKDCIAGYTIANHVSVPHESYFRPSVRENSRDGFCPIGPRIVARDRIDPDDVRIDVAIDGVLRQRAHTADLVRPVAKLIADVSEFMTLHPGDILLVGVAARAPLARAGQTVTVAIDGIGALDNVLVDEDTA